ncbi:MAG TPA: DinB family protein [Thermoplasmata archaeon]|nr:DinB family protein [Thermoplasmata archaeon]
MPGEAPARAVDEVALARAWLEWLADTREGYVDTLLGLSDSDRRKDRGASFPSLEDIFLHILDDNVWWLESVPQSLQQSNPGVEGPLSRDEIERAAERVARIDKDLAASLSADRLTEKYVVRGVEGNGDPFEMRVNLRTIVWHLVEEELQHRGEMNALFWQSNVEAPTRAWFSSPLAE